MRAQLPLYLLLALLGFIAGPVVQNLSISVLSKPTKVVEFGQDLLLAKASPDGTKVACLQMKGDQLFLAAHNSAGASMLKPIKIPTPTGFVNRMAWSDDNRYCAVAAGSNVVVLEFKGRVLVDQLGANYQVRELRFRGGKLMGRCDNNLFIWDAKLKREKRFKTPHLLHADLSDDGTLLALGFFAEGVILMKVADGRILKRWDESWTPASLRFFGDSKQLMIAYRFRNARDRDHAVCYDVKSGMPTIKRLVAPQLLAAEVAQKGPVLLLHTASECILWDLEKDREFCRLAPKKMRKATLSPDGQLLATAGNDKRVLIWDARKGNQRHSLIHKKAADFLNFSSASRLEVTGDSCALWKLR